MTTLKAGSIHSYIETMVIVPADEKTLINDISQRVKADAWVYLTQEDQVLFGRWISNEKVFRWPEDFSFEPCYMKELVIFTANWECRITRANASEGFVLRYVEDACEEELKDRDPKKVHESQILDQKYLMYGTTYTVSGDGTLASEQSGGRIYLPFQASGNERIYLKVRDYFSVRTPVIVDSKTGETAAEWAPSDGISFTDRRLCGFERQNGKTIEMEDVRR